MRQMYDAGAGLLDDLSITAELAGRGSEVHFAPVLAGIEETRSSWLGLFSQRTRWSLGLFQSLFRSMRRPGRRRTKVTCLTLHAWLYHGWPVLTALCAALVAFSSPLLSAGVLSSFVLPWSVLAVLGRHNVSGVTGQAVPWRTDLMWLPLSGAVIMVAQSVGILAAPVAAVLQSRRWMRDRFLHRR